MGIPNLQVIAATPNAACLTEVIDRIVKSAGSKQVIVSAFASGRLRAVREMREDYPDTVEFMEFGGLVGHFLALAGGTAGGLPTRGHNEAAISLACESLAESSSFGPCAQTAGFQELVARMLNRLRDHGLQHEELAALASEAEGPLAAKLQGLAEIQAHAVDTLDKMGKRYNVERIQACLEVEDDLPFQGRLVLLTGSDDAPINLDWIEWVARRNVPTTVVVEAHPTEPMFFEGSRRIVDRLQATPSLILRANLLTAKLFTRNPFPGTPSPLDVEVRSTPDRLAECEWTLRSCSEAIQDGLPPDRIAIVIRRMEEYAPLLEAAAKRLEVPLSIARTTPLLATGVARFLLELLEGLADPAPTRLAKVAGHSYLGLARSEADAVRKMFDAARASSDAWTALAESARSLPEQLRWLYHLLEWRHEVMKEPLTLVAWLDRLRELGRMPWLEEAFRVENPTSRRDHYAINAMQRSLAEVAAVERASNSPPMGLRSFVRRCRRRWEQEEVSVPRLLGGVQVVASGAEVGLAHTVFVLGLLEGVFPRKRREDPILSDAELAWISERIQSSIPDSHRAAREERDEFFRVCSSPAQRLVLSYPRAGEEDEGVKAFYLTEVERHLSLTPVDFKRSQLAPDVPIAASDKAIAEAVASPKESPLGFELTMPSAAEAARRQPREAYTVGDLETVLECPFRYLVERRLALDPRRTRSRWHRIFGIPRRANLPAAPSRESAEKALSLQLDELIESYTYDASPDELPLLDRGGRRMIRQWVDREFETRALWGRTAASPSPEHGKELRADLRGDIQLKGTYAGLSEVGNHKVIHLFAAKEPPRDWDNYGDQDRFRLGVTLASIPGFKEGAGVEVDHPGGRVIYLTPRPTPVPASAHQSGAVYRVITLDDVDRQQLMEFVRDQLQKALRYLDLPVVAPTPGEHCELCDFGELCRRSQEFSEAIDPFSLPLPERRENEVEE